MRYISTRGQIGGGATSVPFMDILLGGLAADGGLAIAEAYPAASKAERAPLRQLSYPQLALAIISKFVDDIPAADLERLIRRTYTPDVFRNTGTGRAHEITPLKTLEPGIH